MSVRHAAAARAAHLVAHAVRLRRGPAPWVGIVMHPVLVHLRGGVWGRLRRRACVRAGGRALGRLRLSRCVGWYLSDCPTRRHPPHLQRSAAPSRRPWRCSCQVPRARTAPACSCARQRHRCRRSSTVRARHARSLTAPSPLRPSDGGCLEATRGTVDPTAAHTDPFPRSRPAPAIAIHTAPPRHAHAGLSGAASARTVLSNRCSAADCSCGGRDAARVRARASGRATRTYIEQRLAEEDAVRVG